MFEPIPPGKPIKLAVWNLDDARWSAALRGAAPPDAGVRALIETFDDHGILVSAVTRHAAAPVHAMLQRHELAAYVLAPRLASAAPAEAVVEIARQLNLALDATLVIGGAPDDVPARARRVACPTGDGHAALARDALLGPSLADVEPRPRRLIYLEELARAEAERGFAGARRAFLASLGMTLTLAPPTATEHHRVRELIGRTNQRGVRYGADEVAALLASPHHSCWLVSLADRFGDCGQIGFVAVARGRERWTLQLLQCSCRVLPRGIDAIILDAVMREARAAGAELVVEVRPTASNEALLAAYHRAGFAARDSHDDVVVLARPAPEPPPPPGVRVVFAPSPRAA